MNYSIYLNTKKLNDNDIAAMKEYQKRLSAYCRISHCCKPANDLSALLSAEKDSARQIDILIRPGGLTPSSEELAVHISEMGIHGISTVRFFIGYAVSKKNSDMIPLPVLSLSSMDISTGLTGVVLYEQLYRSYRILNHQPYHK